MEKHKVIFIDDESSILSSIRRTLRRENYEIHTTSDPKTVFDLVSQNQISAVISDQRMPSMEGVEVLEKVKALSPDTTRVMLTGYSDIHATTNAINKSQIFCMLAKPWNDGQLKEAISRAVRQFALIQENKRLTVLTENQNKELINLNANLESKVLERTKEITTLNKQLRLGFLGSIRIVDKLAQAHSPAIGSHARRVAKVAVEVAKTLNVNKEHLFEIQVAALLHDIGKVAIPTDILEKPLSELNEGERKLLQSHPVIGAALVAEIPSLQEAQNLVRHHHEYYNGKGYPNRLSGEEIPLGSRIIAVADAYDKILNSGESFSSENVGNALQFLSENENVLFDPNVVSALKEHLEKTDSHEMEVGLNELLPGMQLSRNLKTSDEKNLAEKGTILNQKAISIIRAWLGKDEHIDSVYVLRKPAPESGSTATEGLWE